MPRPATIQDAITALAALPPLAKRHYSWALSKNVTGNSAWLDGVTRTLRTGTVAGNTPDAAKTAAIVGSAARYNAPLMVTISAFGGLDGQPPYDTTPGIVPAIGSFTQLLQQTKADIDAAAAALGKLVPVNVVWIDQEALECHRQPAAADYDAWQAALTQQNNRLYLIAKQLFPAAVVVQHARYGQHVTQQGHYSGAEQCDAYCREFYQFTNLDGQRADCDELVANAGRDGVPRIVPCLSLGGEYYRLYINSTAGYKRYDHRTCFAWTLGAEINFPYWQNKFSQFARAPFIGLWPEVLEPGVAHAPAHLVAYVMGANNVKSADAWEVQ